MRRLICGLCLLAVVGVLGACLADAQDKKKKQEKQPFPFASTFTFPKQITLTEEQQKTLDALKKDYLPKLEELAKKEGEILTEERKKELKEINTTRTKVLTEVKTRMLDLLTAEQKEALKPKKPSPVAAAVALPKQIKLTEEQQKKITELEKEYLPKFDELAKKEADVVKEMKMARTKMAADLRTRVTDLLTDEQKQALKPKKKQE